MLGSVHGPKLNGSWWGVSVGLRASHVCMQRMPGVTINSFSMCWGGWTHVPAVYPPLKISAVAARFQAGRHGAPTSGLIGC